MFKPTKECNIYFSAYPASGRRFGIFRNGIIDSVNHSVSGIFENFAGNDDSFPSLNNPVYVTQNDVICVARITSSDFTIVYSTRTLKHDDTKVDKSEIEDNNKKINQIALETDITTNPAAFNETRWTTCLLKDNGTFNYSYSSYNTHYFKPIESCWIYFKDTISFGMRFGIFHNGIANDSDKTILGDFEYYSADSASRPSVNNPIYVTPTDIICVSIESNHYAIEVAMGQIKTINTKPYIKFEKSGTEKFNLYISNSKGDKWIKYRFIHYQKTWDHLSYLDDDGNTQTITNIISANSWSNDEIFDNNARNIIQGNTNFIYKQYGKSHHSGDQHGNEVLSIILFILDGKIIDFSTMNVGAILTGSEFRFIQKSNIYEDGGGNNDYNTAYPVLNTNGAPVILAQHYIEAVFHEANKIDIDNKLLIMQNNVKFEQCHGAMLQSNYGNFSDIICNNLETTHNKISSSGTVTVATDSTINLSENISQKCNCVEMYGNDFYIRQSMIQYNPQWHSKGNTVFTFYINRLKCYFQPVITEFGKQSGEIIETFNYGDVIHVKCYRVIEI